ncbi:sensor domain-containing diguanylate cyclase [Pseudodesulfovibrio tunisiensis]|uniref:sensor domain-containing diguanylate cyclase n=1 Tax=Pseudodesulfovibrio tunisiensis TaxID=463192 RepID=UPI001FB28BEE|nr:sensor domain-containing diguanylate cyclase [Pseudodesulfovibrio tunisiensis]
MQKAVFRKEEIILGRVRTCLESGKKIQAFDSLVAEYGKLLRQSRRLVTMGDRMQNSLNELNQSLTASEWKYRSIFENVVEGIFRASPDGRLVEVNPALADMFGYATPSDFLACFSRVQEMFRSISSVKRYENTLERQGSLRAYQTEMKHSDGRFFWGELSASLLPEQEEAPGGIVGVIVDVTERKCMMEEMCRLARTDSLTGLWNRGYFIELARRELARNQRHGGALSLLMVDVDHFKSVNDSHGHDVGDQALQTLASVFCASVREIDVIGRFGGEEFVILLPGSGRMDACFVADRIRAAVRDEIVPTRDGPLQLSVSIGVTSWSEKTRDLDELLKYADIALYAAKKNGRDRVEVFRRPCCM